MATSFFGGSFFGGEFFNDAPATTGTRPRPGDERPILRAFKPTGLGPRRKSQTDQRTPFDHGEKSPSDVDVSATAAAPVAAMSPEDVEREIGLIMRKKIRTDEDELILLLLIAASSSIN